LKEQEPQPLRTFHASRRKPVEETSIHPKPGIAGLIAFYLKLRKERGTPTPFLDILVPSSKETTPNQETPDQETEHKKEKKREPPILSHLS